MLKNGDSRRMPWLGFITREEAMALPNAVPVKLQAYSYSVDGTYKDLKRSGGEYLQGCYAGGKGVYCVLVAGRPKIVKDNLIK